MSYKVLSAFVLVAVVAACTARQQEVVYVEEPITTEPVFTSKYR